MKYVVPDMVQSFGTLEFAGRKAGKDKNKLRKKEKIMAIKSEAKLTTFEAISMIVGNSIENLIKSRIF